MPEREELAPLLDAVAGLEPEARERVLAAAEGAVAAEAGARAALAEDLRTALGELAELRPRAAHLEAEVERLETELLVARNDLLEAWAQIRTMRNTVSWRATTPFRIAARLGRYG